jgi:hypothetical protein
MNKEDLLNLVNIMERLHENAPASMYDLGKGENFILSIL